MECKYVCVGQCPQLDSCGEPRCKCVDADVVFKMYTNGCPLGNTPQWVEIDKVYQRFTKINPPWIDGGSWVEEENPTKDEVDSVYLRLRAYENLNMSPEELEVILNDYRRMVSSNHIADAPESDKFIESVLSALASADLDKLL